MKTFDMTWYFDQGLAQGAVLLDGSNLDGKTFPLFSCFRSELVDVADGKGSELGYSYPGGRNNLRKLLAEHQSNIEDTRITKEHILVNSGGCSGTFDSIFRTLRSNEKRNEVLLPVPCYPEIIVSVEYNHLKPILIHTNQKNYFHPTAQDIEKNISSQTVAIFLVTPGNPVCTYLNSEVLAEITQIAREHDVWLIVDAIFEESPGASKKQHIFQTCSSYEKLIKIGGWSKDRPQLNDLRLGWSICRNAQMNALLLKAAEISDYSNSTLVERLAIKDMEYRVQLSDPTYTDELLKYHEQVIQGLTDARNLFSRHSQIETVIQPEAGNVLFIKVKPQKEISTSHDLFFYFLNTCNVLVSPGNIFYMPNDELWFRITMSRSPKDFLTYTQKILNSLEKS
jgi:aspartate aminotransferase